MAQGVAGLNGKTGEWFRAIGGIVIAAMVAYFTTIASIQKESAAQQEREANHFQEVLRRLDTMSQDIRELRQATGNKNFYQSQVQP